MKHTRTNHLLRDFVSLVEARLVRGDMTLERGAALMLELGVPRHVTARIIARVQQPAAHTTQQPEAIEP